MQAAELRVRERVRVPVPRVQARGPERAQAPVPRAQTRGRERVQAAELPVRPVRPVRELLERVQPVQVPPRQDGWPTETVLPG